MGAVWEADDEKLARRVAVKLAHQAFDDGSRQRFLREARAAAALNHPNIVSIYDFGEEAETPYLVMECLEGGTLSETPPPSVGHAIEAAKQVCRALQHAHDAGIVHRDLKPSNVLLASGERSDDPTRWTVKVSDLGIALAAGVERLTAPGAIIGTPTFMAPEQALGLKVDGRADLYSLGAMLYLWVTGRTPFEGDDALALVSQHIHAPVSPPSAVADVSEDLSQLILRLLEKQPEARFASAEMALQALEQLARDASGTGAAESTALGGLVRGRLIGREGPLEQLLTLLHQERERPHIALVSGEPGIGKSRLAREVVAAARLDGATVLTGDCYENEAVMPYLPFVQALGQYVAEESDGQLEVMLGDTAAPLSRLAPEIAARLGPFEEHAEGEGQEERIRLFDAVSRFLRRLAEGRKLLVYLDDMQWSDHGTVSLLQALLRQPTLGRIFFVSTHRGAELQATHPFAKAIAQWQSEGLATHIRLERLDQEQTADLLRALLRQDQLPKDLVESLHRETEGNPFFVEEIVKALVADGRLVRQGSLWRQRRTSGITLPSSLRSAISSRISRISEPCRSTLMRAAVLGKTFDFEELASVSDFDEDTLLDCLDEAEAAQIVAATQGTAYAFSHDKIREALYEELNPVRRRRIHARVASGLLELRGKDPRVRVEDLAYHFVASGDADNGFRFAREAAEAARQMFAYSEAVGMLEDALECATKMGDDALRAEVEERLGDILYSWGDIQASTSHYERALELGSDTQRIAEVQAKAAEVYATSGDPRGKELAQAALETLDQGTAPGSWALAQTAWSRYLHLEGRLAEAATGYEEALELVEGSGDRYQLIRILSFCSGTLQHLCRFEESDAAAERAIALGDEHGILIGKAFGHEFLQENAIYQGFWRRAIEHGEEEERIANRVHAGERLLWSRFRAYALMHMGRIDEAEEMFRSTLVDCDRFGEGRLVLFYRIGLACCHFERGDVARAIQEIEAVVAEADEAALIGHSITARAYLVPACSERARSSVPAWWHARPSTTPRSRIRSGSF